MGIIAFLIAIGASSYYLLKKLFSFLSYIDYKVNILNNTLLFIILYPAIQIEKRIEPHKLAPLLLSVGALLFIVFVYYSGIPIHTSTIADDSALYLLSAMAQTLGTILAVVIGFSFVAFQLSTRIQSETILNFLLKSKSLWLMLLLYIFTVFYCFMLLRIIGADITNNINYLTHAIDVGLILSYISLISLFPYAYYTIENLRIDNLIDKNYPMQELIQLMLFSISIDNQLALKKGLDRFITEVITTHQNFLPFVSVILQLKQQAINKNSEPSLVILVKAFEKIGINTIQNHDTSDKYLYNKKIVLVEIEQQLNDFLKIAETKDFKILFITVLNIKGNLIIESLRKNKMFEDSIESKFFNITGIESAYSRVKIDDAYIHEGFVNVISNLLLKSAYSKSERTNQLIIDSLQFADKLDKNLNQHSDSIEFNVMALVIDNSFSSLIIDRIYDESMKKACEGKREVVKSLLRLLGIIGIYYSDDDENLGVIIQYIGKIANKYVVAELLENINFWEELRIMINGTTVAYSTKKWEAEEVVKETLTILTILINKFDYNNVEEFHPKSYNQSIKTLKQIANSNKDFKINDWDSMNKEIEKIVEGIKLHQKDESAEHFEITTKGIYYKR